MMDDERPPPHFNLRRFCTHREKLDALLTTLASLSLLVFMQLHARKADDGADWLSWPVVFAPPVGTALAAVLVVLASPLLLPPEQRYSAGAMLSVGLAAATVTSGAWLACARLQAPPASPRAPAWPAVLPAAALALHRAALHARWLRAPLPPSAAAPLRFVVAPPPVLAWPALGLSLLAQLLSLLMLWRLLDDGGGGGATLVDGAAAAAEVVGGGWWAVAAPQVMLHTARLLLSCAGCCALCFPTVAPLVENSPPPRSRTTAPPSARLDHLKALAAPTQPGAPPEQL